jgi:disulfide bond formation protein DsbB
VRNVKLQTQQKINRGNKIFILLLILSLLALSGSFLIDLTKVTVCLLCSLQRIPYFLIMAMSIIGILFSKKKFLLWCIFVLLISNVCLGTYHTLVQRGVIPDPCKVEKVASIEDFRSKLTNKKSCKNSGWNFFGIPLSSFNALTSLIAAAIVAVYVMKMDAVGSLNTH